MNFIEQLSAIMLLVDFLFGVTFGIVGSASLASLGEDRHYSLLYAPPGRLRAGVRMIHGVYTRGGGWMSDSRRAAGPAGGRRSGSQGPGPQGQEPER